MLECRADKHAVIIRIWPDQSYFNPPPSSPLAGIDYCSKQNPNIHSFVSRGHPCYARSTSGETGKNCKKIEFKRYWISTCQKNSRFLLVPDHDRDPCLLVYISLSHQMLFCVLDTMNYNELSNRAQTPSEMACQIALWLHVGMDKYGDSYRITLHPYALLPDYPRPPHNHPLVSNNVLGVNIQPPDINPRVSHLPEKSTVVNESNNSDNGEFILHQIGIVRGKRTCRLLRMQEMSTGWKVDLLQP